METAEKTEKAAKRRTAGQQFAPLETWYDGVPFRSRTEARWAVFFKHLGIPARYEMQGFALPDGNAYLPDYYIGRGADARPDSAVGQRDAYLEIKGREPSDAEVLKALAVARGTGTCVYLVWGEVAAPVPEGESAMLVTPDGDVESYYAWCECPGCGRIDLAYDGRADALPCRCMASCASGAHTPRLLDAYRRARGERFDGRARGEAGRAKGRSVEIPVPVPSLPPPAREPPVLL